jgi:hypothetical protein
MGSRHAVTRPADGLPDATESHSERADPVARTSEAAHVTGQSHTNSVDRFRQDRVGQKTLQEESDRCRRGPALWQITRDERTRKHGPAAAASWSGTAMSSRGSAGSQRSPADARSRLAAVVRDESMARRRDGPPGHGAASCPRRSH